MDLTEIEDLFNRITEGEPQTYLRKINLYLSGIIAKLRNAEFALNSLIEYKDSFDNLTSSDESDFTVGDKIHFFTDSYFAFLYSAFDVSAQVINQKLRLQINEHQVSLKKVKLQIDRSHPSHGLKDMLDQLIRTRHFRNLDKYRNCSTHRRQIYIVTTTVTVSETPGYTATGDLSHVLRFLCDDPLTLTPTTNQDRELIKYTKDLYDKVLENIIEILNSI